MNARSFESFTQILSLIIKYFKLVVLAAVILVALSGIYRVESNEVAVVLRFGRLVGSVPAEQIKQPGIHFAFPFLIDEVIKVPVQTVLEKEVITHYATKNLTTPGAGDPTVEDLTLEEQLRAISAARGGNVAVDPEPTPTPASRATANLQENGYLLTGDNNVVLVRAMVKYKIGNAAQFALYSFDAEKTVDGVVSAELTRLVTHMDVNSVLTSGKAQLVYEIMEQSQKVLDQLQIGVTITNIEFTEIIPPLEAKTAFEEVISASLQKESLIQMARQSASATITQAEAEANNLTQSAIGDQTNRLTKVHNEMAEFNGMFDQYTEDPQIIINGTFRQRVSALLAKMGASIIVPEGGESPTIILP